MSQKVLSVTSPAPNLNRVEFEDGKLLYLIGTAHVSSDSVKFVEDVINEQNPDVIAVELDKNRMDALKNRKKYEETDIFNIFKQKKFLFFAAQLMLSSYQKKISEKTGSAPGSEFKRAIELAEEREAKLVNADRDISVTLKRTFRSMSFMEKMKFFTSLFFGDSDDVNTESIEELKKGDMLMQVIGEMGKNFPSLKTHILDERDTYLAVKIASNLGNVTVAVVGAAHVPGILKHLQAEDCGEETLEKISIIPPASMLSKALPWIIPAIIIAVFIYGFAAGDTSKALNAGIWWILINGVLSAIGCIIAAAHPLTILAGFIAAPITSLNPTIGVGVVTGLVQLYLVRPVVRDLQNAPQDTTKLSGWWKNKLTRALLVALLSSLGSAIGTFVALPFVLRILG